MVLNVLARKKFIGILETVNETVEKARTTAELERLGNYLADNNITLRDSVRQRIVLAGGAAVLAYLSAAFFVTPLLFYCLVGLAIGVVLDGVRLHAKGIAACDLVIERFSLLSYGLVPVESELVWARARQLEEFDQGLDSRHLSHTHKGCYQGRDVGFSYTTYQFEYSDSRDNNLRLSKQKSFSYRVEFFPFRVVPDTRLNKSDSIKRCSGILVEFPYASGLRISSSGPSKVYPQEYEPVSYDFRQTFSCNGHSEAELARFLNPATVEAIFRASWAVPGLVVEVSSDNLLCLSTSKPRATEVELPDYRHERVNPARNPEALKTLLQTERPMRALDALLKLAHELVKYHDLNFAADDERSSSAPA